MRIISEISLWYTPLCVLLGAAYAYLLYYFKDRHFTDSPLWVKRVAALCRFVTVFLVSFLLISPLVEMLKRRVEKPLVIIAQDNSNSIKLSKDSVFYNMEYPKKINALYDKLKGDYDVKLISFGNTIKEGFDAKYGEKVTDISSVFDEIKNNYTDKNIGALVLASDGLYNQGSNPVYSASTALYPIYTVALGDTTFKKDIVLKSVEYNKTAYLGNSFPITIRTNADLLQGNTTVVKVMEGDNVISSTILNIPSVYYSNQWQLYVEAKTKGLHKYRIVASPVAGEISKANNSREIYIEVLENKQKILLLSVAPHPDITTLKRAISSSDNFELTQVLADKFDGNFKPYDAVVLYQIPSLQSPSKSLLDALKQSTIPAWFILGEQSNIAQLRDLQQLVSITGQAARANEATAVFDNNFSLFTLSDVNKNTLAKLPPLFAPFGSYTALPTAYSVCYQQIGSVKTQQPLWIIGNTAGRRQAVLCGEGLWKWVLNESFLTGTNVATTDLITKTIQYLAVKEDKRKFKVVAKHSFMKNEPVLLEAELYNDNYELVNTPEVTLSIKDKNKKEYTFSFNKTDKAYALNAGYLPKGEYSYKASCKLGDKLNTYEGTINVNEVFIESIETIANHALLRNLSQSTGGAMVIPADIEKLAELIRAKEEIKSISYTEKQLDDLINLKWLFFLLLILLSGEWFLRKYFGAY